MANVQKYSRAALGHLFCHYERAAVNGEYVRYGNTDIDPTRTHLNYNLAPERDISQGQFVKNRCNEVFCLNRKDVNVMCSWVVTMPKALDPNRAREFMQHTYDFLSARYGSNNVVSAYVHMDESTPHMHFAFVPICYDKKKERFKVSAKEVVNKKDLQTFHSDLQDYLEKQMQCEVPVLNGATQNQNKTKKELLQAEITKLESQRDFIKRERNSLIQSIIKEVTRLVIAQGITKREGVESVAKESVVGKLRSLSSEMVKYNDSNKEITKNNHSRPNR